MRSIRNPLNSESTSALWSIVLCATFLVVGAQPVVRAGQPCSNQDQIDACDDGDGCGTCLPDTGLCGARRTQCIQGCLDQAGICVAPCNGDSACITACSVALVHCQDGCNATCATCLDTCSCEDLCVVCDTGSPYLIACDTTGDPIVQLNGSDSEDPQGDGLTYKWTTSCPGATFENGIDDTVNPRLVLATPLTCLGCFVHLTVTEEDGGTATCSGMVAVTDDERPTVGTPAELTECFTSGAAARQAACAALLAVADDNCDTDLFCNTFTIGEPTECGDVIYAFVTDDCDNSLESSVPFEAQIDSERPTATCSALQAEYEVDEDCEAVVTFKGQITDNCCAGIGRNFPFEVKVRDGNAVVGPAGLIGCIADRSDDEKTVDVECKFKVSGLTSCPAVVEWSFDAADCCGNTLAERCVATTNVVDKTKPEITCPPPITLERGDKICNSKVQDWLDSATGTDNCSGGRVYKTDPLSLSIPINDATGVSHTLNVAESFTIEDLNVDLEIAHPLVGNLVVTVSHGGTAVTIIDRPLLPPSGCPRDNYRGILLDDEGALPIETQCQHDLMSPPNYVPNNLLSAFDGMSAQGNWTITVKDLNANPIGSGELNRWSLHFNGDPQITTNAPECGFPYGSTTEVKFTATDACGNTNECFSTITIEATPRVSSTQKGSLLVFSDVEIRWDANGDLTQDTFLDVSNDSDAASVDVQAWFINGDRQVEEQRNEAGEILQTFEPGWNTADCRFELTKNQPHVWSAARGSNKCQPFVVLDEEGPGRLDPRAVTAAGPRVLRGYVVMVAVSKPSTVVAGTFDHPNTWQEIRWNHLKGDALVINYANGGGYEYNAWAYQARCGETGDPLLDCQTVDANGTCCTAEVVPGRLDMDGFQYDINFDELLLDFYASGSTGLSGGNATVMVDTALTLHSMDIDLRQDGDGPVLTKAEFEIFNENESKFSGTRRCICCWDQELLSNYSRDESIPNHFLRTQLRTDKGTARIDGVNSSECDYFETCGIWPRRGDSGFVAGGGGPNFSHASALLGISVKELSFSGPRSNFETAAMNLVGTGEQQSRIFFDVDVASGEAHGASPDRAIRVPSAGKFALPRDMSR